MLKVVQESTLSAIGDAIRLTTLSDKLFLPSEMASEIANFVNWAFYRLTLHTIDNDTDVILSDTYVRMGTRIDIQSLLANANAAGYIYSGTYRIGKDGETTSGIPDTYSPDSADIYLDCIRSKIRVMQTNIPDCAVEYDDSGYAAVISFIDDTSVFIEGVVFDTGGLSCVIQEERRKWQFGVCTKTGTLPTVISTGENRLSYNHDIAIANGAQINPNASSYCFAGMTSNRTNGSLVTLTISIPH